MVCKEGQSDVVDLMVNDHLKTFSTNLNAQHVNRMTPFDLQSRKLVKMHVRFIRYSRVCPHHGAASKFSFS